MDVETILDLFAKYTVILIPLVTGCTEAIKRLIGETLGKKLSPLISILLGMSFSFLLTRALANSIMIGTLIGLSASGLWSGVVKDLVAKGLELVRGGTDVAQK